jgi:hypothetical protein
MKPTERLQWAWLIKEAARGDFAAGLLQKGWQGLSRNPSFQQTGKFLPPVSKMKPSVLGAVITHPATINTWMQPDWTTARNTIAGGLKSMRNLRPTVSQYRQAEQLGLPNWRTAIPNSQYIGNQLQGNWQIPRMTNMQIPRSLQLAGAGAGFAGAGLFGLNYLKSRLPQ